VPQTELFQRCATFPAIVHRPTLINEESARRLVRAWGLHEMKDVTVIEAYAGQSPRARVCKRE
jgi:transcription factor 1